MVTKEQIQRINELAKKSKSEVGLTAEEAEEQKILRKAYIDSFKESLTSQLDNTYVIDNKGNKKKIKRK